MMTTEQINAAAISIAESIQKLDLIAELANNQQIEASDIYKNLRVVCVGLLNMTGSLNVCILLAFSSALEIGKAMGHTQALEEMSQLNERAENG